MSLIRVGYRRLYDALGCSLAERDEFRVAFPLGTLDAEVYMGPGPRFGISISRSDKYVVPDDVSVLADVQYHADAADSPYPRNFFTEIVLLAEVEIPAELTDAFRRNQADARRAVLAFAEEREEEFKAGADVVAGTVGLRLHRQFVLELVNEDFVALLDGTPAIQSAGPGLEILENVSLSAIGIQQLDQLMQGAGHGPMEARQRAAIALGSDAGLARV